MSLIRCFCLTKVEILYTEVEYGVKLRLETRKDRKPVEQKLCRDKNIGIRNCAQKGISSITKMAFEPTQSRTAWTLICF